MCAGSGVTVLWFFPSVICGKVQDAEDLRDLHADADGDRVGRLAGLVETVDFFLDGAEDGLVLHRI